MKTRTIPKDVYPWWTCKINHKEYRYPSGATMSVPDEVAALIDGINAADRQPEQEYPPHLPDITPADEGKVLKVNGKKYVLAEDSGDTLPTVTAADEGKVLCVDGGEWKKTNAEVRIPFTVTLDGETPVVTTTATFDDVKKSVMDGRTVVAEVELPSSSGIARAPVSYMDAEDPTIIVFSTVTDLDLVEYEPMLLQIFFNNVGATLKTTDLAVATE